MSAVRLVHWNEEEGRERAAALQGMGVDVDWGPLDPRALMEDLKASPPELVIIDLTRSPAAGRDVGVAVRVHGGTRGIPLLFVGGKAEKVERVKEVLPDAAFGDWDGIVEAVQAAIASAPSDPVVPASNLAGYSGTPLPKKLGIKPGYRVLLARSPEGVTSTLGPVPEGVRFLRRFSAEVDLILWFVRSRRELADGIRTWSPRVGKGSMWVLWPKKTGSISSDLTQQDVRRTGLDHGLVDFKICAFDADWSGLKFSARKKGGEGTSQ